MALVEGGVPFDVAMSLTWDEIVAWGVILSEVRTGKRFNWSTLSWPESH